MNLNSNDIHYQLDSITDYSTEIFEQQSISFNLIKMICERNHFTKVKLIEPLTSLLFTPDTDLFIFVYIA